MSQVLESAQLRAWGVTARQFQEHDALIGCAPIGLYALRTVVARAVAMEPGVEVGRFEGVTFHEQEKTL